VKEKKKEKKKEGVYALIANVLKNAKKFVRIRRLPRNSRTIDRSPHLQAFLLLMLR
jgi:hypothetical protein